MADVRLIDANALMKHLNDYKWEFALRSDFEKAIEMIDVAPTINPEDCRPHGQWIGKYSPYAVNLHICSVCNLHLSFIGHLSDYNYCPKCGAKMNGKEQGE